jgi:hypothetical protein
MPSVLGWPRGHLALPFPLPASERCVAVAWTMGYYKRVVAQDRSGLITLGILTKLGGVSDGLPTQELAMIAAWYSWWQPQQFIKGIAIQAPEKTALSIQVLATNYIRSMTSKAPNRETTHVEEA